MVAGYSWQDVLSVLLAGACASWLLWITVRPFVQRVASACGLCSGCSTASGDVGHQDELLQIAPPDPNA